ncbi:hypothetical protein Lgra_1790 [Legionella gratiana]|uniref:Opacity protein and related surface antigens n=1 Tax=Legionella gratiana TaxID=45066 RepID=A0A378JH83_9GAMM|nr:hypothetical protein [Legionella gratiana]KTD10824.1 hypothetical protein Lgra_1790 [Legionella gratiana]STX44020.1 Opacity protein and related surface antigens [Legionella gratiana]
MNKRFYVGLSALAFSSTVFSGSMGSISSLKDKGFFVGIGGSYSSVNLEKQTLWGKGVNSAYLGPILTSTGSASGYSDPFYQNENLFSPQGQVGYFQHFTASPNFWGIKFIYDYLNAHFSDNNMTIAQAGSNYNVITGVTTDFTGNYLVDSVQTSVNHELLLLAFIGHSFQNINIYLGGGPVVFGMQSNIYNLVGYADYKGNPGTDISGAPVNLSQSMWEWGGAAQLGLTYFLNPSWFLDFNYTYARTGRNTIKYVSPFTNQIGPDHLVGTSYINPSQQVAAQSFSITMNKLF